MLSGHEDCPHRSRRKEYPDQQGINHDDSQIGDPPSCLGVGKSTPGGTDFPYRQ